MQMNIEQLKNEFLKDKPCVFIHSHTMLTEIEREFWLSLRSEFNSSGYELLLSGPVMLDFEFDVPYIYIPTKLDFYTAIPDVCVFDDDISFDRYLKREDAYYGTGDDEVRKHGVQVVSLVFDSLLDSLNIVFVLVGNGNHAVDMLLFDKVEERNINHIFFERGPFPGMWHLDEHGMTAGTDAAKRSDCAWFDDTKWIQIFKDYEDYYKSQKNTWWHQPDTKSDVRELFNIPKDKKIILFANQLDNDTSNFLYAPLHETNLDALKWLCEQLEPYKDKYFILGKHHPVNSVSMDEFKSVVGELGVWTNDVALDDALMQSDYVCAVNSTLLYEALIYREPCLMLGQAILSGKDIVYEITSLEHDHVDSTIKSWLNVDDKDEREERWLDLGASLLSDCLYSMNTDNMEGCVTSKNTNNLEGCVTSKNADNLEGCVTSKNTNNLEGCVTSKNADNLEGCVTSKNADNLEGCVTSKNTNNLEGCVTSKNADNLEGCVTSKNADNLEGCVTTKNTDNLEGCVISKNADNLEGCVTTKNTDNQEGCVTSKNTNNQEGCVTSKNTDNLEDCVTTKNTNNLEGCVTIKDADNQEGCVTTMKGVKEFADEVVGRCDREVNIKNSNSFFCFYRMLSAFYEHRFLTPMDKNILKLVSTGGLFQEILLRIKSKLGIIKR